MYGLTFPRTQIPVPDWRFCSRACDRGSKDDLAALSDNASL